jgi:hypothetical protein
MASGRHCSAHGQLPKAPNGASSRPSPLSGFSEPNSKGSAVEFYVFKLGGSEIVEKFGSDIAEDDKIGFIRVLLFQRSDLLGTLCASRVATST